MPQARPTSQFPRSPLGGLAAELSQHGSSQLRSRTLGQGEHNVMLALGMLRAGKAALGELEPKLLRVYELLVSLDTPREGSARSELAKLRDELTRALNAASFDGHALFEGGCAVFDVEDSRRSGEPLSVTLPDLATALHGQQGLTEFLARRRPRAEAERTAERMRLALQDARHVLRDAERQLSALLTHFHRQRSEHAAPADRNADLAQTAVRLGQHVLRAGSLALLAQGELSTRASSLVLGSDEP
ncbi:MAG TPA: hypothetical protein VJR89_12705 [Polyangiales bacterium]|nr:hypothetical protein [Polyangiales bacterium]